MHHVSRTLALILVLSLIPATSAHSDDALQHTLTVSPGASEAIVLDVHWHRLIATVDSKGGAPVELRLVHGPSGSIELEKPLAAHHQINHLVRCCDDSVWTPYHLIISNPGGEGVEVRLAYRLMHDDFVVAVERAESGIPLTGVVLGAIGVAYAVRAHRNLDRVLSPAVAHARWRRAQLTWTLMVVPATLLGGAGMIWQGTGPFTGAVAVLALLPRAPGAFGAVAYFGIFVLVLWFVTLHLWTGAMGQWHGARRRVVLGGIVLTSGVLLLAMILAIEHDALFVPALFAVALAGPVAWTSVDAYRRPRQVPADDPGLPGALYRGE